LLSKLLRILADPVSLIIRESVLPKLEPKVPERRPGVETLFRSQTSFSRLKARGPIIAIFEHVLGDT